MKPTLLLVILFLLTRLAGAGPITYLDLVEASARQQVKAHARADGLGADQLHCTISNQTNRELHLRVPPGLWFEAADAGAQDIFTFEEKLLVLAPGATRQVPLWALCMERNDHSPASRSAYAFRGFAGRGLQALGDSLHKYPGLESYRQMFVWALTDHEPLYEVSVAPAHQRGATNVMRYVCSQSGQKATRVYAAADSRPTVRTFSKNATLLYHSPTAQVATLKVYDTHGREMYALFSNRQLAPGVMRYTVGINSTVGVAGRPVFSVRLLGPAGQLLKEMKVDDSTPERWDEPEKVNFYFPFELAKPMKNAKFRVRLPDGTLVEEITQRPYLPAGRFRFQLFFNHLYPAGTAFVARLEDEAGRVIKEQPVVNEPAPADAAPRRR